MNSALPGRKMGKSMTIVILTAIDDEHGTRVQAALAEAGQDAILIDSRWFPEQMQISYQPNDTGSIRLPDGRQVRLEDIRSVYWRNYFGPLGPKLPNFDQTYVAGNDARGLFESLLVRLPVRWVNGWHAYQSHQTKPAQLAQLRAHGIPIPDTVVTNDPRTVQEFAARHSRAIYKPVQGGAHAQRLEARHLTDAHLRNLVYAPITLQEEIGGVSVRVFVAGDRTFACELETESLDYRDDPQSRVLRHNLPGETAEMCRLAARALDLVWTGIDLRRTPSGRYVLLEANPSPMFLGFEAQTGLPLTDSLVGLLRP
jgi:hypothetical protein